MVTPIDTVVVELSSSQTHVNHDVKVETSVGRSFEGRSECG